VVHHRHVPVHTVADRLAPPAEHSAISGLQAHHLEPKKEKKKTEKIRKSKIIE
jgi:hypothetical protein